MNAKAFSLALFSVVIWGSSFPAIRVGLQGGYDTGQNVLVRFLIASLLFLVIALWPGVKFQLPHKGDIIRLLVLGWIGISVYHKYKKEATRLRGLLPFCIYSFGSILSLRYSFTTVSAYKSCGNLVPS